MMTAKGIYLDLDESTYFYRYGNYKFYFSSKLYRGNFIKRVEQGIKKEKDKFEARYNVVVTNQIFYAFYVYATIEKRGFRVVDYTTKEELRQMPDVYLKIVV